MAGRASNSPPPARHLQADQADQAPPTSGLEVVRGDALAAQAGSPFFASFPAEIRTKILVEALGDRVLHVVRWKSFRTGQLHWSGGECGDERAVRLEESASGRQRCSCVGGLTGRGARRTDDLRMDAAGVGALGWLASCRAALAEGLDVLYGRNALVVSCETLRPPGGVGNHLPAPALARVASLRWALEFPGHAPLTVRGPPDIRGAAQLALLGRLLGDMSSGAMPRLRRLYLAFDAHDVSFWDEPVRHFKRRFQLYTRDVLPLLDGMVRAWGRADVDMEVGMPASVFYGHWVIGRQAGLPDQGPYGSTPSEEDYCIRQRIWRPVEDVAEEEEEEEGGGLGRTDEGGHGTGRGYWISSADYDLPVHFLTDGEYRHLHGWDSVVPFAQAWNSPCDEVLRCVHLSVCMC